MALRISRAIPYFCGLPYRRRMARRVMTLGYTGFVDDSGGDGRSPVFVLGAWIARCDAWETFSEIWEMNLGSPTPKALGYHKGKRYFRHTDALTQQACFAGFTAEMAARKAINLARLVQPFQDHMLGYAVTVPMDQHKAIVQDQAIVRRGDIHRVHKNPFYLAFRELVPDVYESYWNQGLRDPVDIIVDGDKTDMALKDMRAIFASVKEQTKGEPHYAVMGDIFPRSAKDLGPLQLADMLAGQTRMNHVDVRRAEVLRLWEKHKIQIHNRVITQAEMEAWSKTTNATIATRVLTKIKAERENPRVMSKRRVKKKRL